MYLVECSLERHGSAILEILNHEIVTGTALYDYRPRPASSMVSWFEAKRQGGYPVLGIEDEHGTLLGFASCGVFRAWPAYKYSVETSLYVRHDRRRTGIGSTLLDALIRRATEAGYHVLVAGIDATNGPSIALHEKHGFVHAGTLAQCGFKFGRWLDLALYQLVLPGPPNPVDG